jgi:hypothetical protein
LWTADITLKTDFENANDGIFYLTPADYKSQFTVTGYAEIR